MGDRGVEALVAALVYMTRLSSLNLASSSVCVRASLDVLLCSLISCQTTTFVEQTCNASLQLVKLYHV